MRAWIGGAMALVLLAAHLTSCRTRRPSARPVLPPDVMGLTWQELNHDERVRGFLLYVPASVNPAKPSPLIMAFHGDGQTPRDMMEMTGFNAIADQHGLVVVYPSGTGANPDRLYWNVLLSQTYATINQVDDLGFVSALLDWLGGKIPIDDQAIFATGFSQGGMLCYRIACDERLSRSMAAIATVAASMTVPPEACAAHYPVPLLSIHGMLDPYNRFEGGVGERASRDQVARPGVPETISFWAARGGLLDPTGHPPSRGMAHVRHFGPGEDGFEVISWELEDGGHTWPGGTGRLPEWMMGRVSRDIHATSLIWEFFRRHSP